MLLLGIGYWILGSILSLIVKETQLRIYHAEKEREIACDSRLLPERGEATATWAVSSSAADES